MPRSVALYLDGDRVRNGLAMWPPARSAIRLALLANAHFSQQPLRAIDLVHRP